MTGYTSTYDPVVTIAQAADHFIQQSLMNMRILYLIRIVDHEAIHKYDPVEAVIINA